MIDILATLLEEAFDTLSQARNSVKRHLEFPKTKDTIKVAIGMRRFGKTYLVYQTINHLLSAGVAQ